MEFREVPPEEDAVHRFLSELWLPYQREYETLVEGFALADDPDLVETERQFRLSRLGSDGRRLIVALDAESDDAVRLADTDAAFAGFVETEVETAPEVFDYPDRLRVCDLYVDEAYRGEGLGRELMSLAADHAREEGCPDVTLDVDVENERAVRFYENLGFETTSKRMRLGTSDFDDQT